MDLAPTDATEASPADSAADSAAESTAAVDTESVTSTHADSAESAPDQAGDPAQNLSQNRRGRTTATIAAITAAALVVGIGAGALLAAQRRDGTDATAVAGGASQFTGPDATAATFTGPIHALPGLVPEGFEITHVEDLPWLFGTGTVDSTVILWSQPDTPGEVALATTVVLGEAAEVTGGEQVTVRGRIGRHLAPGDTASGLAVLTWEEQAGSRMTLSARDATPGELAVIADGLQLDETGTSAIGLALAGEDLVPHAVSRALPATITNGPRGSLVWLASADASISIVATSGTDDDLTAAAWIYERDARPGTLVDGVPAFRARYEQRRTDTTATATTGAPTTATATPTRPDIIEHEILAWFEADGVLVVVNGFGVDEATLAAVAASVTLVDDTAYSEASASAFTAGG